MAASSPGAFIAPHMARRFRSAMLSVSSRPKANPVPRQGGGPCRDAGCAPRRYEAPEASKCLLTLVAIMSGVSAYGTKLAI